MSKPRKLPIGSKIGILGGGQLGKMLSLSASQLGFKSHVFDPDINAPAKQVTNLSSTFDFTDLKGLTNFANKVDVITYEFENIPVETINFCNKITKVYPSSKSLEICQDRVMEKKFLNKIGIQTVPFEQASSYKDIIAGVKKIGLPLVLKTSRFGYDGKGQKIIHKNDEIENIVNEFSNNPVIIEKLIDFKLEISIIISRDMNGKISAYDPSENKHQNGILIESKVPANISFSLSSDAVIIASKILKSLNYIGVMGIEFFVTKDNNLLVNEMAPRVHNSGHWTQTGCIINQFEQHIRAISGRSVGDGERHSDVQMKNVLGDEIFTIKFEHENSINIYGKDKSKVNRKMGHINTIINKKGQ